MRVLHVTQPTVAGVPVVVRQLAVDQAAHGLEVVVACPDDGDLPAWLDRAGIARLSWPATRAPGPQVLGETRSLAALVRRARPDLVHLHSAKAGLAGRLALRGATATVFQPHAWSFEAVDGVQRRLALRWERAASRWTDLQVCVSEGERETGALAGVRTPALVLPNGVDLRRLSPADDAARTAARRQLGLPDGPLVVCVGRLARQKGQDLLLAGLPRLARAVPGVVTVLVGDGPDEPALRTAAPPAVVFAGARPDVAPWLVAADVVALPSRWEAGLSLVAMEAMAVGRPVVSADVAGVRLGIGETGAGAVVPTDDADALADALAVRLLDPARAAAEGRRGRAHVELRHDQSQTAPRVRQAYEQVLAGRATAGRR